jgi:hypothetical protein
VAQIVNPPISNLKSQRERERETAETDRENQKTHNTAICLLVFKLHPGQLQSLKRLLATSKHGYSSKQFSTVSVFEFLVGRRQQQ